MALQWSRFARLCLPTCGYLQPCSFQTALIARTYRPGQQICGFCINSTTTQPLEKSAEPQPSRTSNKRDVEHRPISEFVEDLQRRIVAQTRSAVDSTRLEKVVKPLLDMGFDQTQVKLLFDMNPSLAAMPPPQSLSMASALTLLGLNASSVLKILAKCPELFRVKEKDLQPRIDNLRKLGLVEGSLQRVIAHCPQVLILPPRKLNNTTRFLKEKCLFTGQQVTEIIRTAPNVLFEDSKEIEYKFQYTYFRMGIKQPEMVKSGLFQVPLFDIKVRHIFLERLGTYQTPNKKGHTQIENPKLNDFLSISQEQFLAKVAHTSQEEFEVFKKLLAREEEEEQRQEVDSEDEGTDSECYGLEDENDSDDEPDSKLH